MIPRWLLRSIFALFPEQLLNGMVSWRSPGRYSMIDCFLGDALEFRGFVLPVLEFCSAVWCSAADAHLWLLDRVVSGASILTGVVFECDFAHRRYVAVLCMLYKIRCNPMHPLNLWCSSCAVCAGADYTRSCDRTSVHVPMSLLAAEPRCIAGILFPCQYQCATILATPCSMVRDWWVSRAGPMPFYWLSSSLTFCLLLFSLSLFSFYGLVLRGWGLRTDRVLISQPCITNLYK